MSKYFDVLTMRAATTFGLIGSTKLSIGEAKQPIPGPNDVLVEVKASSVNPKDWKLNTVVSSLIPNIFGLRPFIIGDDLSGVIVAKGDKITNFNVGDCVYGMDMRFRTAAAADYAIISAKRVALKPNNVTHAEAATVPLAAQTAFQAFKIGALKAGDRVLIIGASGGVGTFAVQIAKAMGADVTGVCSNRNVDFVRSLGADAVFDYTQGDYRKNRDNFNLILDATSYESPQRCRSLLKDDGIFITTAGHFKAVLSVLLARLSPGKQRARIVVVESYKTDLEALSTMIEAGKVTPVIDSEYSLTEIQQAYDRSRSGRARGKIVININC